MRFLSSLFRGNSRGTGICYIPKSPPPFFKVGQRAEVVLRNKPFFARVLNIRGKLGVYVPKKIAQHFPLHRTIQVTMHVVNGFYSKVGSDGRIYIPSDIAHKMQLNKDDIILVKGISNQGSVKERYSQIHIRKKPNKKQIEYMCMFGKVASGQTPTFQITKAKRLGENIQISPYVSKFLKAKTSVLVGKNLAMVFAHKLPVTISTNIFPIDFALHLGAYFSDGTRIGNNWAISASTFQQASYYLQMHQRLIKDARPEFVLSYTNVDKVGKKKLVRVLRKKWKDESGIEIDSFRIRKPEGLNRSRWNKYGTLTMREGRATILDFYNFFLQELIGEIQVKKDRNLALDFLCGVLEGDGGATARKRGHILISTNRRDVGVLARVLDSIPIRFKIIHEGGNRYFIRIGALEVLRIFSELKDKLFRLYPRRRKALFERLWTVGAVKFLTGEHVPTSWVKRWLLENNLVDELYKITRQGKTLRRSLMSFGVQVSSPTKSVTVE